MITELRIYWQNNPLFSNQGQNFTIGMIDDTGALTQISNNDPGLLIEILEPSSGQLVNNNNTIIVSPSILNNITLRLKITYQGFMQYFSYVLVPPVTQVTRAQIFNNYINLLPQNVYTRNSKAASTIKQKAITEIIYQLYNNDRIPDPNFISLINILNNIYPISGNSRWEVFLTGNNRLLYQNTTQYGELLQLIYQAEINNNTNPYWLAFNISKYIFLWLGIQKYVYVGESNIFNLQYGFIINNNSLGNCVLTGTSQNNKVVIYYVLADANVISLEERDQITQFARLITRAGATVRVEFDYTAADLGLITDLGNTYWKDPRQEGIYCIKYNQNILNEALGLTGINFDIGNLIDFTITLNPGGSSTNLTVGQTYQVIITPTFSAPVTLPQPIVNYTSFFSLDKDLLATSFVSGIEYFTALATGTVTVNIYLGIISKSCTYTIS